MKIKCSAGKGVMDHEDCLVCSLSGNQNCGYDYAILRALYSHSEVEDRAKEIHVTDMTGCLRRAWYSKSFPMSETPHSMFYRGVGTIMHGGLEGNDFYMKSEIPFDVEGVKGRVDMLYRDGRLVDLKTTRWLYPDKVPYGSHALQVNIYAHFLKKTGTDVNRLQIQYLDMSGPTKCRKCKQMVEFVEGEHRCPNCLKVFSNAHLGALLVEVPMMDEREIADQIEERQSALVEAIRTNTAPEKEPGFLCAYCSFADVCQPGATED